MSSKTQQLLFIYNADSGRGNALLDSLHKITSPNTYDCKLCELTYGIVSENSRWKRFRKQAEIPMVFLHRDEFKKLYSSKFGYKFEFPIVLSKTDTGLEVAISGDKLRELKTVGQLIKAVKGII